MDQMIGTHSPDEPIRALEITLRGGPAAGITFYAFPGRVTSIFAVGLSQDESKHLYAYDAQSNRTTYLGPQQNHYINPVILWVDPPQRETY